jgi:hypothetical protein
VSFAGNDPVRSRRIWYLRQSPGFLTHGAHGWPSYARGLAGVPPVWEGHEQRLISKTEFVKCHVFGLTVPRASWVPGDLTLWPSFQLALLSLLPEFGAPDDRYLRRHVAKFHNPTSQQDGRSSAEGGPLDICSLSRCPGRSGYRSPGHYVIKLPREITVSDVTAERHTSTANPWATNGM